MSKQDFSDYEKRRARQHEELCRAASTLLCVNKRFCHRRMCRRQRLCTGPMLPSPHQAGAVRAQREIGLTGRACAELPQCMANQEPWLFKIYRQTMNDLQRIGIENPQMDLIRACAQDAAMRRFKPDGS